MRRETHPGGAGTRSLRRQQALATDGRLQRALAGHEVASAALAGLGARQGQLAAVGVLSLVLGVVAVDNGGFDSVAWGWASLALLFAAIVSLVLTGRVSIGRRELAFVGCLAALAAWTLASAVWSSSAEEPVLESERAVVYLAACLASFFLLRRSTYRLLLGGTWTVIAAVCTYSLSTRLFPTRLGVFDPIAGYRLSEPIGYWNGLGLFAAMGVLLSLGFVIRARHPLVRFAAGSSLVVEATTLYFTFSRGAWISLAAGLVALVALDRRRLQVLAAALVVGPWPAVAIWIASRSRALTHLRASLDAAAADGWRVALAVTGLALVAGAASLAFGVVEARIHVPRSARRLFVGLVVVAIAASLASVAILASPSTLPRRAYHAFTAPSPAKRADLNQRLFRLSAGQRIPQWHVAWKEYRLHPWLGGGAGTYEAYWLQYRRSTGTVQDAHNLYLETLGELGPIGLVLLLVALALPLRAAVAVREHGLASAALGGYVAYLVDAAGEWDWELPAVTLVALFLACALLLAARGSRSAGERPAWQWPAALAVLLGLSGFAFVGLVGNSALRTSAEAVQQGRLDEAKSQARKATHWMPWAAAPWQQLGEADLYSGDDAGARRSLRRAIAKDAGSWQSWYLLALASTGRAQRRALEKASLLDPLSPQLASLRTALGVKSPETHQRPTHSGSADAGP